MSNKETRVSNDMRRAQAETVPEERLKHMASSPAHIMQSSAPVSLRSGELRGMAEEILASRQALRSTPVEAEPVGWVDPRSLADLQERKRWTTAILIDKPGENATTPLYAHPLPNPSPSGEVSEAMVEAACDADSLLHGGSWSEVPAKSKFHKRQRMREILTAALQSKRGQP